MARFSTVLFDLDGTLLDTHRDMVAALNVVLDNHGKNPVSDRQMRPFVSKGAMTMVCLVFQCPPDSRTARQLWQEMLDAYAANIAEHTALFPGMQEILEEIGSRGLSWGIVTNKPGALTGALLAALQLPCKPGVVVSGDTLATKKPDPAPLYYACEQLGTQPDRSVYIGDDERDIQAAHSAGMFSVAAAYGYIAAQDNPLDWNANACIREPSGLRQLLF